MSLTVLYIWQLLSNFMINCLESKCAGSLYVMSYDSMNDKITHSCQIW